MNRDTIGRTGGVRAPTVGRLGRAAILVTFAVSVSTGLALMARHDLVGDYEPLWLTPFGAFALVGALIVGRQPRNVIGWLFGAIGVLPAASVATEVGGLHLRANGTVPAPVEIMTAWMAGGWYWFMTISLVIVFVPLLFPDGRLASPRWRPVLWTAVAVIAALFVLAGLAESLGEGVQNPIGIAGVPTLDDNPLAPALLVVMFVCAALAVGSMFVRYRTSGAVQRRQLKWMLYAASVVVVLMVVDPGSSWLPAPLEMALYPMAVSLLPVSAGIAILRYRLYDIDRLVSRTVSYVLLTLVLAGVYVAGVVGIGGAVRNLGGTGGGDLVVAASTLLVAAAFGPVRRRIQTVVDRRFNRGRYDAARTVERFGRRLRDEVDLEVLRGELVAVVSATVQPHVIGLWTPPLDPPPSTTGSAS